MPTYGLTSTGFVAKPLADIKADLEAAFRGVFGAGINTEPESNFGLIIGILSERYAELWQLGEQLYASLSPDSADGVQLDNLAALTGTVRADATNTKVSLTLTGTNGTLISAGRIVSNSTSGDKFTTLADVTISGGTATVEAEAVETGPIAAPADSLTVIDTPVAGWTTVNNPLDHSLLGTDLETAAAFRIRREDELRAQGNAAVEAIREAVLAVTDVTDCTVFENDTDATDGDGLPPHSIECLVQGGDDVAVATAIFSAKAAGIATYGTSDENIEDSQGLTHDINFTRPTGVNIYVVVNLTANADLWPADGETQVKAAIAAYGDSTYETGDDVISSALIPAVFSVSGVTNCPLPFIGTAPSPVASTTVSIGLRQLADLDTSRITVNATLV